MKEVLLYVAEHSLQVFLIERYYGHAYNENCHVNFNVLTTYNYLFVLNVVIRYFAIAMLQTGRSWVRDPMR
jgi:hypothetical protein